MTVDRGALGEVHSLRHGRLQIGPRPRGKAHDGVSSFTRLGYCPMTPTPFSGRRSVRLNLKGGAVKFPQRIAGPGWFLSGLVVAVLVIPTTVGAVAALQYTGLEGPAGNRADVSPAGQLNVAPAAPTAFFQSGYRSITGSSFQIASPPSGTALVVTVVHLDVWSTSNSIELQVYPGRSCAEQSSNQVGSFNAIVPTSVAGEIDLPLTPGLLVPTRDSLCGFGSGGVNAWVSGYTIPAKAGT